MRIASCLVLLVAVSPLPAAEPKAKPNVVIIMVYGMGPRDLGCTGSTYYKTPNLDAFAKQGVKLEEAYLRGDIEGHSFYSLRTGRNPERTFDPPEPNERQYLEGKSHEKLVAPKRRANANFGVDKTPADFAAAKYRDLSNAAWWNEDFLLKLKATPNVPFFATYTVFSALKPSNEAMAKYKPGPLGTQSDPENAARIEGLDRKVGEILKALDDAQVSENTFVVCTSANSLITGYSEYPITSNAPYRDGQGTLYEGGLRVPFLIRGPGIKSGNFAITGTDVLPTMVGLCGLSSTAKYDGIDLSAQLLGKAKPDANRAFYANNPYYSLNHGRPGGAIRVGSMKLIEYFEDGRRELFDLSKDIGESKNLAAEKPELVKELAAKLAAWRRETGVKIPVPNPNYEPNPQFSFGDITLHARTAFVTGVQLRFEPAPHKNTLGYWTNAADTAFFEFTVTKPGTFAVSVLQGAGKGSGGAEVELAVGDSKTKFTVKDTGGFQQFETREVGELKIDKPGRHTLTVTPKSKPGVAVMDLREVKLTPKK